MFSWSSFLVACAILYTCDGAYLDIKQKCSIKDESCILDMYTDVVKSIGSTGIPELNIPPIDPMHITNLTMEVIDGVKITIDDGTIKGISKCQYNSFHVDLEKKVGSQDLTCNMSIKGHILLSGSSPMFEALAGSSKIEGDGKGKLKIEKLNLKLDFPINLAKKDDGKMYIRILHDKFKYNYKIGNASFNAEKVLLGKEDITKTIVEYMNGNWRMLLKNFGKGAIDKAVDVCLDFADGIFDKIPADTFFTEDLTPYV